MLHDSETHGWAFFHLFHFLLGIMSEGITPKNWQTVSFLLRLQETWAECFFFFFCQWSNDQVDHSCWILQINGSNGLEMSGNGANGDYLAYRQWITTPFSHGTITTDSWNLTCSSTRTSLDCVHKSTDFLGFLLVASDLERPQRSVTEWFGDSYHPSNPWLSGWMSTVWITCWKTSFLVHFSSVSIGSNWNLLDSNKWRWKTFYFSNNPIAYRLWSV